MQNRQRYNFYVQQIIANANSCESIEQVGNEKRSNTPILKYFVISV